MGQAYNDSTKRPKPKENQLGILRISTREFMHFARNSAYGLGSRRKRYWGYVNSKSSQIFFLNVVATLLTGSRKGTVGAS